MCGYASVQMIKKDRHAELVSAPHIHDKYDRYQNNLNSYQTV